MPDIPNAASAVDFSPMLKMKLEPYLPRFAVEPRSMLLIILTAMATAHVAQAVPQATPVHDGRGDPQMRTLPISATRTVASLAEIAGEWDIVRFDNHSPRRLDDDGKRKAYVDINRQHLGFAIGCNYSGMMARIENGVLHHAPIADITDGVQTLMGCGREQETRDARFFDFFYSRPKVSSLPGKRMRMVTSNHELLLERSSVRRLAMGPALSEITGSWRVVRFNRFEGGGHRGWGTMYAPGRVRIEDGNLSYSRCPTASVHFTYMPDFVLQRTDGGKPVAAVECRRGSPAPTEVELMLAALLGQSPEAERVNDERFILRSRHYAVVLTSEANYQREFGE